MQKHVTVGGGRYSSRCECEGTHEAPIQHESNMETMATIGRTLLAHIAPSLHHIATSHTREYGE